MRRNSLAWIVMGGCAFGLTTMELAACSSDSTGTGNPTPQTDATANKDGTTNGEGGTNTEGGTKTDGSVKSDAGVDCGSTPSLHPRPIADGGDGGPIMSFLCPFSSPKGVKPDYCKSGEEHCCVSYTVGVESTCETSCPAASDGGAFNGRDFECLDPVDCNTGVCCGLGQVLKDDACNEYFGKSFKGTKCATSCDDTADEFNICQSDDQCEGGKTCQAMSAVGAQFGFCQ